MAKLLVLHGPNLNLLGIREPERYGHTSLPELDQHLKSFAKKAGHDLSCYQSNAEDDLVTQIQNALAENINFIIINAAALTHTSIALRDALLGVNIPFIEVHISNVHSRESFRHESYLADIAVGVITGLGIQGYELALQAGIQQIQNNKTKNKTN